MWLSSINIGFKPHESGPIGRAKYYGKVGIVEVYIRTGQCLRRLAGGNAGLPLDTTQAFCNKMAASIIILVNV